MVLQLGSFDAVNSLVKNVCRRVFLPKLWAGSIKPDLCASDGSDIAAVNTPISYCYRHKPTEI